MARETLMMKKVITGPSILFAMDMLGPGGGGWSPPSPSMVFVAGLPGGVGGPFERGGGGLRVGSVVSGGTFFLCWVGFCQEVDVPYSVIRDSVESSDGRSVVVENGKESWTGPDLETPAKGRVSQLLLWWRHVYFCFCLRMFRSDKTRDSWYIPSQHIYFPFQTR